ncbi:uncharacterized protein LOC110230081, partial [Arabidopsis lyrata subsp. lyrata]|uniref:uncharacterized protein LOC110230081 n=1 Tax=Arabidopsis lyrata subsp. lyrata TaxID=81972 RepID=UPI000A29C960
LSTDKKQEGITKSIPMIVRDREKLIMVLSCVFFFLTREWGRRGKRRPKTSVDAITLLGKKKKIIKKEERHDRNWPFLCSPLSLLASDKCECIKRFSGKEDFHTQKMT